MIVWLRLMKNYKLKTIFEYLYYLILIMKTNNRKNALKM